MMNAEQIDQMQRTMHNIRNQLAQIILTLETPESIREDYIIHNTTMTGLALLNVVDETKGLFNWAGNVLTTPTFNKVRAATVASRMKDAQSISKIDALKEERATLERLLKMLEEIPAQQSA